MFILLFVLFLVFLIVVPVGILIIVQKETKEREKCQHNWILKEISPPPIYWYCCNCRLKHEKIEE